jgi:hypothetical protein
VGDASHPLYRGRSPFRRSSARTPSCWDHWRRS